MDDPDLRPAAPGSRPVTAVLASDPGYRLLGGRLRSPIVLGLALACLVVVAIVFGAAGESRFIYTDF